MKKCKFYEKLIKLANNENICLDNGNIKIDSFYVRDNNNGYHRVPEKNYDDKIIDKHFKFKISLMK